MSKHYSPFYFLSQSFKGLWRNGVMTFASVAVLTSMLVVMGGFALLVMNINRNLEELGLMSDIVVVVDNRATDEEIEKVDALLGLMKDHGLAPSAENGGYEIVGAVDYLSSFVPDSGDPDDPAAPDDAQDTGTTDTADPAGNTDRFRNEPTPMDGTVFLEINTITHVTKAEALASLREADPELYADITDENNPLPDEFIITYSNSDKVESITTAVWSINSLLPGSFGDNLIKRVQGYEQLVNNITTVKNAVTMVFTWFMVVLGVVSIFIIINTIKLSVYSRRNEIMIMRYVGASGTFITLPFIGEGVIIGLFSGILAFFLEKGAYSGVIRLLSGSTEDGFMQMIKIVPFSDANWLIFFGFLLIGVASGIIGSCISLFKYSKT